MKKLLPILTLTALLCPLMPAQERARPLRPQQRADEKAKTEEIDWASVKKRIEGAVERGDMTREQANQKYTDLKKKRSATPPQQDIRPGLARPMAKRAQPTELSKVVSDLLSKKKISNEDARRILQAASIKRSPGQFRQLPNRDHKMAEELREVLNAAREELALLREARKDLMEHHPRRDEGDLEAHRREIQIERAHLELEKQAIEQQKRGQQMRQEAEHRMREIAEQSKKLDERRRAAEQEKKKSK